MVNEDRCVCCGAIIPEGTQVCPLCQKGEKPCLHVWQFECFETTRRGKFTCWKCATCGAERREAVTPRGMLYQDEKKYTGLLEED